MEHEAKRRLMERLDECLKEHGAALGANGLPSIGEVYEVQGLAEMHYYLKVEHVFNPAEVEALLRFKDPLDVARWCKEDNTHPHSLPICELLDEINAYQRFPQVEGSGPTERRNTTAEKSSVRERLQDAAREAAQHPAPESKPRDAGAR